jgi:hypothetical protein
MYLKENIEMTQLNISLPPPKDSPDFDGWLVQVTQYLRDYLGLYDSLTTVPGSQVSFLQAGTGAVSRTAQNKMRDFINVFDFGAVGNGTTDDTAAIQLAINYAAGRPIFVPDGTYKITSQLTYSTAGNANGLNLQGDGIGKTYFDSRVGSGAMLKCSTSVNTKLHTGLNLTDFSIMTGSAAADGDGIELSSQTHFNIESIEIIGMDRMGLVFTSIGGDAADTSYMGHVKRCKITGCGHHGIFYNNTSDVAGIVENRFSENIIVGCGLWGMLLYNSQFDIIDNNTIVSCGLPAEGGGISIDVLGTIRPPRNVKINNNWFEHNSTTQLLVSSCVRASIKGNGFTTAETDSTNAIIIYTGSHGARVEENEFFAHATDCVPYTGITISASVVGTKISGCYWRNFYPAAGQFKYSDSGTDTYIEEDGILQAQGTGSKTVIKFSKDANNSDDLIDMVFNAADLVIDTASVGGRVKSSSTGELVLKTCTASALTEKVLVKTGGDVKFLIAGKGLIMTNAAGTVTKRVRLNDAGDGLIYEAE